MSKFCIGERVVHVNGIPSLGIRPGTHGVVVESLIPRDGETAVRFQNQKNKLFGFPLSSSITVRVREDELRRAELEAAKAKPSANKPAAARRVVIDITDDGAFARYIEGKKTLREAAIKRFGGDTPHDPTAAMYAVRKLWPKSFDKDGDTYVNKLINKEPARPVCPNGFIRVTDKDGVDFLVNAHAITNISKSDECGCEISLYEGWIPAAESFDEVAKMVAEAVKD